jgi:hypothetical protein
VCLTCSPLLQCNYCCPPWVAVLQGGTLVVCPTTVLHQWAQEVRSKVNPHAGLSVHVYHGKGGCWWAGCLLLGYS